jgi:hypothetical protein
VQFSGAPVTVTATASGVSGSADVYVLPTFDSLVVTLSATLAAGRTVHPALALGGHQENAAYTYQELPELRSQVHLATSNPGIVSVESDGALRAVAGGHATMTATLIGETTVIPVDVIAGYTVQPVPGTDGFLAKGVNDAAAVIVSRPGSSDALIEGGTLVDLGACSARDLNDAGQVACAVHTPQNAFVFRPGLYSDGSLRMLFDSTYTGKATGVTESGAVFGQVADSTYRSKPFIWTTNGVTYPTTVANTWSGSTYAVNSANHGVAVYEATSYPFSSLLGGSSIVGLPHYGGRWSQARDVNDADDVVGSSERMKSPTGDVGGQATIWRAANSWNPENPGYRADSASAISEAGLVVGNGRDGPWVWRAGRYTILNDALATSEWKLTSVADISRSGIVAAQATNAAGAKGVVLIDLGSAP